jgi:signal transduction histidine kinase
MMPLRIEWQEYDLQELAENLVTWARSRYPQLEVRLESEAMPPVPGDPQRLMQVGRALLSNACAAARRQVVCRVGPEGDQTVSWSIRDDGPGLPPEQTAQLFTDLALSSRDRLVPGLVLAGRLIALHGGQIKAENRPEGGLLVHVVLPMKKDEG